MSGVTSDTKLVMVIDTNLPLGLIANTAAVLALSVGAQIPLIGPDVTDGSQSLHRGITTIPIPILKSDVEGVKEIRSKASAMEGLFVVDVTDAAQTTTTYEDYTRKLSQLRSEELRYLGVVLYGPKKLVNKLTGSLALLR